MHTLVTRARLLRRRPRPWLPLEFSAAATAAAAMGSTLLDAGARLFHNTTGGVAVGEDTVDELLRPEDHTPAPPPTMDVVAQRLTAAAEAACARLLPEDFDVDTLPALRVLAESLPLLSASPALRNWDSTDWLMGLTVMAQYNSTQRARGGTGSPGLAAPATLDDGAAPGPELLRDLVRYVRICDAVYADTTAGFCQEAGLPEASVVLAHDGGVLAPRFVLIRNDDAREILVAVRGTSTLVDFLTDVCLVNEPFHGGQAHRGMAHAARSLIARIRPTLTELHAAHPDYRLILAGHSLGAGVSALAALELRPTFPTLECIAFAAPATVTRDLAEGCRDFVTTVINGDDCVPRLHQHSLVALQGELATFDWRATLRGLLDDELAARKADVLRQRDAHVARVTTALRELRDAKLEAALGTPVGQTVVALWSDDAEPRERLAKVKSIAAAQRKQQQQQQQQQRQGRDGAAVSTTDEQLWRTLERSVEALEGLVQAVTPLTDAAAATLKTTTATLATATTTTTATTTSTKGGEPTKKTTTTTTTCEGVAAWHARLTKALDETTQQVGTEIMETIDEVSQSVTTTVQDYVGGLKEDVEEAAARLEADAVARIEALVSRAGATVVGAAAVRRALLEFDTHKTTLEVLGGDDDALEVGGVAHHPLGEEVEGGDVATMTLLDVADELAEAEAEAGASEPESDASAPETLLHEPLYPPGRILFLPPRVPKVDHAKDVDDAIDSAADAVKEAATAVALGALVAVPNHEFERIVLSNRMLLDHLCTAYERVLLEAARREGHHSDAATCDQ